MANSNAGIQYTEPVQSDSFQGQPWLVEERDACGVGFIAHQRGIASHQILQAAIQGLSCVEHRGGCSADRDSGDGAGIMAAIPWSLIEAWATGQNISLGSLTQLGCGMFFLPAEPTASQAAKDICGAIATEESFQVLGWREVPVKPEVLGIQARENQPHIEQLILQYQASDQASALDDADPLERRLYLLRKRMEAAIQRIPTDSRFRIPS